MITLFLRRLGAFPVLLPLFACSTQLDVIRANDTASNVPLAGAPYNLTFTRYKLKVTRRIDHCVIPSSVPSTPPKFLDDVAVKVDIAATKSEARDPRRTYVIDMLSLQSFFKTTDVQVTYYDSGALKTINAAAEDRTGEFAASVASTVSTLLVGAAKGGLGKGVVKCLPEVADAVMQLPSKEKELVALTEQIAATTERVRHYTALALAAGRGMSQADREQLSGSVAKLVKQQEALDAAKNKVRTYLALISVVDETAWPQDGDTLESAGPVLPPLGDDVLRRWIGTPDKRFADNTAVFLKLQAAEPIARTQACTANCPEDAAPGVKYRMPALGALMMCNGGGDPPSTCRQWQAVSAPELISQLGRIYTLPLKSTLFSNKTVSASFSESGVPTLLGVGSSAGADKAAATLGGVADAVIAARSGPTARENAELEAKIKNVKLQEEYRTLMGPKLPPADTSKEDATAQFTVDTALVNAELANIEARRALAAIKNP